jgi:hypothetical protein
MRRHFDSPLKAEVVLAYCWLIVNEEKSIHELFHEYGVHANRVHQWCGTLLEKAANFLKNESHSPL